MDSSHQRYESSVRESSASSDPPGDTPCTPVDFAITQLIILGTWMHKYNPEISNGTVLSGTGYRLGSAPANSRPIGHGFTASVNSMNVMIANPTTARNPSGHSVVKRVRTWHGNSQESGMAILRELKVLISPLTRRHPNIVSLEMYAWEVLEGGTPAISPVLYLERAAGSLAELQTQEKLPYSRKRAIMLDISRGLSALHAVGVIHGDLKSENVLVFQNGNGYLAKLCDFGFSIILADIDGSKARLVGGTALWMAPECSKRDTIPASLLKKTDYYPLGLLFWRILLDGYNPFCIPRLTEGREPEMLKLSEPSLLVIAQFSVLLLEDYVSSYEEIFRLLAATIQKRPWHRSLGAALMILGDSNFPVSVPASGRVTLNPHDLLHDERWGFHVRNIEPSLRRKALKHLMAGAKAVEQAAKSSFPGFCPVSSSLLSNTLGDGGLDVDDDPEGALRLMTECAERQYVPFQSILVRMYDYFGIQMPDKVAKRANEFLWNGVANGSVTACLDYATYWPRLKYQTQGEPDVALFGLRTFFSGGIGIQVDFRVGDLRDKALLEKRLESGTYDKASLQALYGLERGNNLLHGAAMLNLHRLPEMLIRKFKADVNEQNNDGDTPLLLACRHGHFPLIVKLLSNGARANIANKYGETPLHWVINVPNEPTSVNGHHIQSVLEMSIMMLSDTGDLEAKAQLYSAGGDDFTRLKWAAGTPLHRAVSRRNLAAARYLLKQGADPLVLDGSPEEDAVTPLDLAMHHHNAPMLKLLLDASQYDINNIDKYGTTLFSRAISAVTVLEIITIHGKRYPEAIHDTMELLMSRGLNLKVAQVTSVVGQPKPFRKKIHLGRRSNYYEFDGLYLAVYFEKLAWVQFMLNSAQCMSFLDINRHNGSMGMTALHQSVKDGRKSIFKALLAAGADPSSRFHAFLENVKGFESSMTCLHLVATQGDDDLFFSKRLLAYDLDLDACDLYGTTPFALAVLEGHFHVANALLEAGSDIDKLMCIQTASQGRGETVLERVLAQGANGLQRLQYLLSRERSADDAAQDKTKPWLSRPGQPASLRLGHGSTALHYFLHINKGRTDSMFVACFRTILDACGPSLLDDLALPTPRLDVNCKRVTPLHIAVENADPVVVQMLLDAGADRCVTNEEGILPLDVGRQQLKQRGLSQKSRNIYRDVIRILEGNLGSPAELEGPDMGERLSSRLRDLMT